MAPEIDFAVEVRYPKKEVQVKIDELLDKKDDLREARDEV